MTLFGTIHVTWSEMLWMKSLWYAALLLQVRMVVCLNPNAEEFDESVVSKLIQFVKVAYKKSCICSQTLICLPPSSSFVCLPPRHLFASLLSMSWSLQNSLRMLLLPDQNLSSEFQISCKEKFMSFRGPFGWFCCGQMLRLAQVFAAFWVHPPSLFFAVVCILVHPLFFDSSRFDTGLTPGRRRGKL